MQKDILDLIKSRRSTRSFLDKPVRREDMEKILEAAIWAPSGSNGQSWLFTAILDPAILEKMNEVVREGFKTYIPDDDYPAKRGAKASALKENFNFYNHAPALIIASNRPNYENAMADCSLALQNIFLMAESLGLGSCYINTPHWLRDDPGLREFLSSLGVPREHTICSSAAIGYIDRPSSPPARKEGTTKIIG